MVIVIIYLEEKYIKNKVLCLSSPSLVFTVNSMFNVFGESISGEGQGNLQVLSKVIAISGKYADYINEIRVSQELGYPAYRIATGGSPTFVFTYENKFFCLGAHLQHIYERTPSCNENALPRILVRR